MNRTDHLDLLRASLPLVRFAPWFAGAFLGAAVLLAFLGQWLPAVFGIVAAAVVAALPYLQAGVSERNYPLAGKEIRASADPQRLKLDIDAHAHSELRWDKIRSWSDTGRTIVLRAQDAAGGYPIPHRAFRDPAQAQAFTQLLHSAVGDRATNRQPR